MARLLTARALRDVAHCSACGAPNPHHDGDGYTTCCLKRVCTGWAWSETEGCCPETRDRLEDERARAARARRAAARPAAPVATPAPVAKKGAAARTTRTAQGAASVKGWELLYDKPKAGAEVGRRYVGGKAQYALICKAHGHVHGLERLSDEGKVRKAGGWCPSC